jgi:RNA polymerase sigma-70 factor (sigma-E family)
VDERTSFADFVRTHSSSLYRTAFLLTGNAMAAEDLVQESLTRLYPRWALVEAADAPVAYVRRSLTNTYVSSVRRRKADLPVWELPDRWDGKDMTAALVDREFVWRLLAKLSERQRAAVVLRYLHDLDDEEIAAALDCRTSTVRSLISRAMATMRQTAERAKETNR